MILHKFFDMRKPARNFRAGFWHAGKSGGAQPVKNGALERERERAEGEKLRMGRVYQALGVSGGAFLVILLL